MRRNRGWGAAVILALAMAPGGWAQEGAMPKQKDGNARFQPKEATFTTAIIPAEAKPGEEVKLEVRAKLKPKWHIYKFAKKQDDSGPRSTEFDLYRTDGLEIAGEWAPAKPPKREKEPAFPDIEFVEFYEEEAVWSIPLKVPADAAPGEKTIKVQAYYQLCDDKSCSRPGRWTLPEAKLTVAGDGAAKPEEPKKAEAAPAPEESKPAVASASPAKPDDSGQFRPGQAKFATAFEPAAARPGATVTLKVTATLEPGWHLYEVAPKDAPGPHTELELFDPAGLAVAGEWKGDGNRIAQQDSAFPEVPFVEYYEGEVTWSIPLKVPDDAPHGSREAKVQAYYQICDAQSCSRPGRWTLPAAVLTISADAAPTPAAAVEAPVAAKPAEAPSAPATSAPVAAPAGAASTRTTTESAAPVAGAASPAVENNVQSAIKQGFGSFLLLSALGGLFALAMPCVWPMVPVTVNFFIKQGQARKGRVWPLALVYSASIVGIFTLFGVFCAFAFDASSLKNLANNPWLNIFVATLFFVFAASLLGLFEIQLPSFLLNASVKGEGKGGLIGIFFMALTLTITSFTCTLPVVGGLVLLASQGEFFYPIVGMMVFSAVVALPFLLLALSPGWLASLPKSGDWMNTIKVVGGLIEVGAAFKFINTAELAFHTPDEAWFDSQVLLTIWVVLSLVSGIYLLGLFRTDHDHGDVKIGPGRLLFGTFFLGIALYIAPALFGVPPKSEFYEYVMLGILPPDSEDLIPAPRGVVAQSGGEQGAVEIAKATSSDPKLAQREQTSFHGVLWGMSYDAALEKARELKRPVLVDFTGVNCANCRLMEKRVMPKPEVVTLLKEFVTVQLHTDFVPIGSITADARYQLGEENFELETRLANDTTNPFYVIIDPQGERVIRTIGGYTGIEPFVDFLKRGLAGYQVPGEKVARAGD